MIIGLVQEDRVEEEKRKRSGVRVRGARSIDHKTQAPPNADALLKLEQKTSGELYWDVGYIPGHSLVVRGL